MANTPSSDDIKNAIAAAFEISDIRLQRHDNAMQRDRKQVLVAQRGKRARFAYAYVLSTELALSGAVVARMMGVSDHTTVRHYIKRARQFYERDDEFALMLRDVYDRLKLPFAPPISRCPFSDGMAFYILKTAQYGHLRYGQCAVAAALHCDIPHYDMLAIIHHFDMERMAA